MFVGSYTEPVKFTDTGLFGRQGPAMDDVYTIEEFRDAVAEGCFTEYDGWGRFVKDGKADANRFPPEALASMTTDATHVVWYNK